MRPLLFVPTHAPGCQSHYGVPEPTQKESTAGGVVRGGAALLGAHPGLILKLSFCILCCVAEARLVPTSGLLFPLLSIRLGLRSWQDDRQGIVKARQSVNIQKTSAPLPTPNAKELAV